MNEIETLMREQRELFAEYGLSEIQLWCHHVEFTRADGTLCHSFSWTLLGKYFGQHLQLSQYSLEGLHAAAKQATGLDVATRELLLSL